MLLHRLRVRLGPLDVFVPPLLKPAAQHWRGALARGAHQVQPMPRLPAAGGDVDGGADPRGAALAYRRLGRPWLRIDLADRLASHARQVRSAGGDDPVDRALAISVGLDEDVFERLMAEIGFARAGGRGSGAAGAAAPRRRTRRQRLCRAGRSSRSKHP